MKVVQVVKRFGLCGGMEEYAYRLANELCILGVKVKVVCEEKLKNPKESNIETFELGKSLKVKHIEPGNYKILNNDNVSVASVIIPRALKAAQSSEA